jgi:sulfhydrogenase subunit beta (sulfur reductase)
MQMRIITEQDLQKLLGKLAHSDLQLYAPQKRGGQADFAPVTAVEDITSDYIQTARSAKAVLFPPVEELLRYQNEQGALTVREADAGALPRVVLFGVRPCDAAAIAGLNAAFTRDSVDEIFAARLRQTTVIACSCAQADDDCFCTSVGTGPGDTAGSDILLTKLRSGDFLVEILTDKGEEIRALGAELFSAAQAANKEECLAAVPVRFDPRELQQKLADAFDHPFWQQAALACLGCGACAYVCPACSCFDIQDEGTRKKGVRVRCWDSCGLSQFTLHTSGHNPRSRQSERWRQRIMHKFSYLPDQAKLLGCVGCGRCSRACPADVNLVQQIQRLMAEL